jgi:Domain of unknown function (DUF4332)
MTYLITEIAFYLGAAAVIGFLTGWLAQESRRRASKSRMAAEPTDSEAVAEDLSEQLEWMKERLKEQESESNETVGRMASEIEQMRPLLESLSSGMEESARDMNSDRETRERAEQAAQELEEIEQKFKELAGQHEKLQSNYDKVADKIVEYETERIQRLEQKLAPPPDALFDDLPDLERSGGPLISGVIDLDEGEDLQKPVSVVTADPLDFEPPEAEVSRPSGAARPLDMIPGLPKDVIGRMDVLGLRTNIDLLRKCATPSGLNGLSKSMGLSADSLSRWVAVADLLRLECVRKNDFPSLIETGIDSVESLATSSPDELSKKLQEFQESGEAIPLETVAKWIDEARSLGASVRS